VAVNDLRRVNSVPLAQRPMPRPYVPRSMVITARRAQPGAERAQLVVDGGAATSVVAAQGAGRSAAAAGKAPNQIAAAKERSQAAARASDLLRQIRLAEAQGRPADELRQQLYQAVEAMKP
ncbi:MAG: hypothetical protein V5A91_09115, partial [Candidatus Accumulibacter necessarius]